MTTFIASRQNPRVRELRAALAGRGSDARGPGGTVALEGVHLLREAIAAEAHGVRLQTVFLREDQQHIATTVPNGIEVLLLSASAFDSAAATQQSQGVAALLQRPQPRYEPTPGDLLLLAAGLQDPGNLGTLIRSAEAFGAAAVVLTEGTVDPWNGKAMRASAGSVFRMPTVPWTDALHRQLKQAGIRLLAAVPAAMRAIPAHAADLRSGCACIVGNEGKGIPAGLLALADERITLTMPGPTESLNAAVAGSLLLYEASRQRS